MIFHIKKYFGKLNKKQTDEIGTLKSPTKPLYLTKQRMEELSLKKQELEDTIPRKYEIQIQIEEIKNEIEKEEEILKAIQDMETVTKEENLEKEKIKIQLNAKQELEENKKRLEEEKENIKFVEKNKKLSGLFFIIPIIFLLVGALLFLVKLPLFGTAGIITSVISLIIIFIKNQIEEGRYKKEKEEIRSKKQDIQNKLDLVNDEIEAKNKDIKMRENSINLNFNMQKEAIKLKYPNIHVDEQVNTQEKQNFINNLKLNLSRKKLEENEISEKLETLTEIEEKLNITSQEYKELIEYDDVINISKNALNNAYLEMKESITPKFTENLSYLVKDITSGKYNNIKVNEENGLALETANRKLCYSKLFK